MPGRLRQLRLSFGMDQPAMADLVGCSLADWNAWEEGHVPPDLPSVARNTGVALAWLEGHDVPVAGPMLREMQEWAADLVEGLPDLVRSSLVEATPGERIGFVLSRVREEHPDLLSVPLIAGWLGLSIRSAEMLLAGQLDPGAQVIARASELTGLPESWFRAGPTT